MSEHFSSSPIWSSIGQPEGSGNLSLCVLNYTSMETGYNTDLQMPAWTNLVLSSRKVIKSRCLKTPREVTEMYGINAYHGIIRFSKFKMTVLKIIDEMYLKHLFRRFGRDSRLASTYPWVFGKLVTEIPKFH